MLVNLIIDLNYFSQLTGVEAQKFAMAIVRVMSSIMAGSSTTKVDRTCYPF